ncbi:HEAT repeat domain-containing protein [Blastococcus sp. VKM Ac-2987]|uniref:HEAT repeat domain-containing protein n=1 Tax=Blastococcus sp. VKM Ac-2987 TaxID=3004141 RepID=UPI0022AB580D|nr:HEAT repeat domain-containing protein [Blastococcus sp. VKM Ac-2987]MCZ2858569.1 HEAT repeat domain-containing protein [Blastococcus sp. VKM Ac-2987]
MSPPVGPALLAGAGVTVLIVVLLATVATAHLLRGRRSARDARRTRELMPLVHALLDDDPADGTAGIDIAGAPAGLDEIVLDLLPQLRGSDRQVLRQVLAERGVVARAVADLSARRSWRRGRAVALLGSAAGGQHIATMAARLQDRSLEVRCAAARALGKAGEPAAVAPLLRATSGARALPQGVVGMALLDLGTSSLPVLREALVAGDGPARQLVAELLGVHGDLSAAPLLEGLLRDTGEGTGVRRAAAGALGRIGSPTSTEPLVRALSGSADASLQRTSAEALGRIGDPVATAPLLAGLAASDVAVRAACADALVRLGREGRAALQDVASGPGAVADVARAALDQLGTTPSRPQPAGAR